jgi:hypothetical protein
VCVIVGEPRDMTCHFGMPVSLDLDILRFSQRASKFAERWEALYCISTSGGGSEEELGRTRQKWANRDLPARVVLRKYLEPAAFAPKTSWV